jgi:hypothetical protein
MRFHGADHEDYGLMGCDTVQFGTLVPTFQCNLLPLFSQKNSGLTSFDDTHTHTHTRAVHFLQARHNTQGQHTVRFLTQLMFVYKQQLEGRIM